MKKRMIRPYFLHFIRICRNFASSIEEKKKKVKSKNAISSNAF